MRCCAYLKFNFQRLVFKNYFLIDTKKKHICEIFITINIRVVHYYYYYYYSPRSWTRTLMQSGECIYKRVGIYRRRGWSVREIRAAFYGKIAEGAVSESLCGVCQQQPPRALSSLLVALLSYGPDTKSAFPLGNAARESQSRDYIRVRTSKNTRNYDVLIVLCKRKKNCFYILKFLIYNNCLSD